MANNYDRIPHELREYKSWIVWRDEINEDGKRTKIPYRVDGSKASVTDPNHWSSFDLAVKTSLNGGNYSGIGFVLSDADPYSFIDLDSPHGLKPDGTPKHADPQAVLATQERVYETFDSYAERSPSGTGLHIIVRGKVPSGRRRNAIELYSRERYMTVTGDVYRDSPIVQVDPAQLNAFWLELAKETGNVAAYYAGELAETSSDQDVIARALNAANAEKFRALYNGEWQQFYQSQSEADFAFVDMVGYYSKNKAQIARIFRNSALGDRPKAQRGKYVNAMLDRVFDNMPPPVDIDNLQNQIEEAVAASKRKAVAPPATVEVEVERRKEYEVPPGLLGEIARFIYAAAPRPVPEIAIAGAIGLMCGIVGKAYNVSGTGLNQYVLLLAATGTGKEGLASGIEKLMSIVGKTVPPAIEFVGPGEIASSQALAKHLSRGSSSFVSILGEFGLMLKMMSMPNAPTHLVSLRRMFLDLFGKSGEGHQLRATIYSDKEKNTQAVISPAFSIIGESTPTRFYEALSESMIDEGLLPRFLTIEYDGPRPELNANRNVAPSRDLIDMLCQLCAHCLMLNSQHKVCHVGMNEQTEKLFAAFDKFATDRINSTTDEVGKQLWNRAHLKSMKLAALVAVGINPYDPVIDESTANWAIDIVTTDVQKLKAKFEEGMVGQSLKGSTEYQQMQSVARLINDYMTQNFSKWKTYKAREVLHDKKIIEHSVLSRRVLNMPAFRDDKNGATFALKRSMKNLVDAGAVAEIPRSELMSSYGIRSVCYVVSDPKYFEF